MTVHFSQYWNRGERRFFTFEKDSHTAKCPANRRTAGAFMPFTVRQLSQGRDEEHA
jgi:hypothetical protein